MIIIPKIFILILLILYIYTMLYYEFYARDFYVFGDDEPRRCGQKYSCETPLRCLSTVMLKGGLSRSGLQDYIEFQGYYDTFVVRNILDTSFVIIYRIFALKLVLVLLVFMMRKYRKNRKKLSDRFKSECLLCGYHKTYFELK